MFDFDPALMTILCCPDCRGDLHGDFAMGNVACVRCGRSYTAVGTGILDLMPSSGKSLPESYNDPDYQKMSALFDEAQSYFTEGNSLFNSIHNASHATIRNWLRESKEDGWTCDVGCGQGHHWEFFEGAWDRFIGIDIRLESLEKIRRRHKKGLLIQADLTSLPFKDGAFQRLLSIYALEHIYHLDDAVSEMARILPQGGQAYIGLPCEGGLAWNFGRKLTSERTMSKRYNLDYRKYIRLEHCNDAADILETLSRVFNPVRTRFFPLSFLPAISLNLIVSQHFERRP
ncbi:MAG: methyltransferase domain-containing protein [Rhodospirillaceae bacterium]|nr:methyltransferase domain-containing protein [Rhodospirillaceae bacterium]